MGLPYDTARWPDDCEYERKVAMSQAAAVLELVGPERLAWVGVTTYGGKAYDTATFGRTYRIIPKDGGEVYLTDHECGGFFATIELAQAAALAAAKEVMK